MAPKHKRASKPKVKTGCVTCKIRRVKCDEQKPECGQCTNTGRKCDGYIQQTTTNRVTTYSSQTFTVNPDSRIVLRPGTREERQHIHLFCTQTSRALSGLFPSDLWNHFLPQLSQSEPVVRHAVIAVSASHERFLGRQSQVDEQFAIQQYNKAIRHLMEYLASPNQPLDLTLITCCLFVCLEMLNGNIKQALDHLEAGLNILHGRRRSNTLRLGDIDRELTHLCLRLNIQLSLHGRLMVPLDLDDTTYRWTNILEARHCLDRLMNNAMGFIRQAGIERSAERAYLQPQQQLLLQGYSIWISSFEALMGKSWKRIKVVDGRTPLVLRITYLASLIWLETCLSVDEMIFDHHNDSFDQLVRYAKEYIDINDSLNQSSNGTPPDSFTLEAGIVTPLFYTAVRCRNPITRREAIHLLSRCHVKEGLWNTKQMVSVAEAVLEMEETSLLSLPLEQRIPADRDRVYEALMPNEGTPVEVIFLSRPDGREWCTWTRLVY